MRVFKTGVGWLAALSLLAALVTVVASALTLVFPWFDENAVYLLERPRTAPVARALSSDGKEGYLGSERSGDPAAWRADVLRRFATVDALPERAYTGLDAIEALLDHGWVKRDRRNVAAAALVEIDGNRGRVVAAWPEGLVGREFSFSVPLNDLADSASGPTQQRYPVWSALFRAEVRKLAPDASEIILTKVVNSAGQPEALLVTAAHGDRLVSDAPPQSLDKAVKAWWVAFFLWLAYVLLLPLWVGLDAAWRGMRPFAWGILALLTNWIGLLAYLMARLPPPTSCPNCGERVLGKYVRCPSCGTSLTGACPVCRSPLRPGWQHCPVCNGVPAQAGQPAPQAGPIYTGAPGTPAGPAISILVVDTDSGAQLSNIRVRVEGPTMLTGLTNRSGMFEPMRLKDGEYTVTAEQQGYESAQARVTVTQGLCESVVLRVRARPAAVSGVVREAGTMLPLDGAHVFLDTTRIDRSSQAGGDGWYILEDLPPGPYTLRVEAEGFEAASSLVELAPGALARLDVTMAKPVEPADAETPVEVEQ